LSVSSWPASADHTRRITDRFALRNRQPRHGHYPFVKPNCLDHHSRGKSNKINKINKIYDFDIFAAINTTSYIIAIHNGGCFRLLDVSAALAIPHSSFAYTDQAYREALSCATQPPTGRDQEHAHRVAHPPLRRDIE
jgi:hypothetical protein